MKYETWLAALNETCLEEFEIEISDFLDTDLYAIYEQGFSPSEAWIECQVMSREQFPDFAEA